MKLYILIFSILYLSAQASVCEISSIYTELEQGINKEEICNETILSLTGTYTLGKDLKLEIEIKGNREMYSVELTNISLFENNKTKYNGSGYLFWNPEQSYVRLD